MYTSPLSTVLAASQCLHCALPGLAEAADNIALWFFQPVARNLVIDWDHEATHVVAGIRGALARYRTSVDARALLRALASNPDFTRIWTAHPTSVTYGRRPGRPIRLRDNGSKVPITMTLQISEFRDPHSVIVAYGISQATVEGK